MGDGDITQLKYFLYKSQNNGLSKFNWELHRLDDIQDIYVYQAEGDHMHNLFKWTDDITQVRIWRSSHNVVDITTEEEWIMEVLKG